VRLKRWVRQRWCGLTKGHLFTRHCSEGWFGEQCFLCDHRRPGIAIGPARYAVTVKVPKRRLAWLKGVHLGKGA
jgi:hypothetical protein